MLDGERHACGRQNTKLCEGLHKVMQRAAQSFDLGFTKLCVFGHKFGVNVIVRCGGCNEHGLNESNGC